MVSCSPTHCLRRSERSDYGDKGVSLCILRCRRPQGADLLSSAALIARLIPEMEIASWRTCRIARRKRNVSDLPYAASPFSCAAFFFKEHDRLFASRCETEKGDKVFRFELQLVSPECEDSPH